MSWSKKLIYGLNIVAVICLIFAYVSPYVNPARTWFFAFFGLGYPLLIVTNLCFVIIWVFTKPKYAMLSLITLAVGYIPLQRAVGFNKTKTVEEGFSVMSYNIGGTYHHFSAKDKKNKVQEFKEFIRDVSPDIVCLQERRELLIPILDEIFIGYNTHLDRDMKTCIYSKLPIENHGKIQFESKFHSATWVDVMHDSMMYRIYGIHLSSNKVPNMTDNINEIIDESVYVLDEYSIHAIKRVEQIEHIMSHAEQSPHPVMITGDYNDMPQSYLYRKVSQHYCDAFIEHGSGLGKTQKTNLPGLRIDYAFADADIKMLNHKILKSKLSDHSPIITTIR